MHERCMRITCYDFLTRGRESYSGELVTASEWNTSLVIGVTCDLMFAFFLYLVPSLNDEKRIEVRIPLYIGTQWSCDSHVTVMWLSHDVPFPATN